MKKTALLLGMLALMFPASGRSQLPNPDSEVVLDVGLLDEIIHLSPRIVIDLKQSRAMATCLHCWPPLKRASFTLSLNQDHWTMTLDLQ